MVLVEMRVSGEDDDSRGRGIRGRGQRKRGISQPRPSVSGVSGDGGSERDDDADGWVDDEPPPPHART